MFLSVSWPKSTRCIRTIFTTGRKKSLRKKRDWKKARALINKRLRKEPENHWLLTRLSLTFYEERKYDKALEVALKGYKIKPRCPLVLWDLAGAYDMVGKEKEAIKNWKKIIKKGEERIAYNECGEGLVWARSLINDSLYRIGLSYNDLGKYSLAIYYIQKHIMNRKSIKSIYNLRTVKKKLEMIKEKLR